MGLYRLRSLKDRVLLPLASLALRLELKPETITMFGGVSRHSEWMPPCLARGTICTIQSARSEKESNI